MTLTYAASEKKPALPVSVPDVEQAESGQALDAGTRSTMEQSFGRDFSQVRVHADDRAAAAARSRNAHAYSVGPHIMFGAGRYAPGTFAGQQLIAHELAHVAQRDASGGTDTGALEADAHHAATAVSTGRPANVRQRAASGVPLHQTATQEQQAPPQLPSVVSRNNIGRHGNVDAEYSRPAGMLTVQLKVLFRQDNSIRPWPSQSRFNRFIREFIESVTSRWSFKHYLVPVGEQPGEPQRVAVRVQVSSVTSGQHVTANVRYADDNPTSSVSGDRTRATLDQADTEQRSDIPQTPAQHEFGHMLGLKHIHCDTNDDECYGTTPEELADVMGSGSFVSPRDYEVFAEIIRELTGNDWRVQQASFVPTSRGPQIGGAIGAVVGGIGLGAIGAAIGSLAGPIGGVLGGFIGAGIGIVAGYFAGRAIGTPRIPS